MRIVLQRDEIDCAEFRGEALSHVHALYHFARYLTGNSADAEDLVQESYARALAAAETFVRGSNMKAWMMRILRNLSVDNRRRARREPIADDADQRQELIALDGDVADGRLSGVIARDIESAIMALSPDARAVILLDLEGLTAIEVASIMGCKVNTVKSRLLRARATLRHTLKEYAR